jgi:hypothetical protein
MELSLDEFIRHLALQVGQLLDFLDIGTNNVLLLKTIQRTPDVAMSEGEVTDLNLDKEDMGRLDQPLDRLDTRTRLSSRPLINR